MENLTDRQREIYEWIVAFWHGYPPAIREIGDAMGISSPNGVQCNVRPLQRKGYLADGEGARQLVPVRVHREVVELYRKAKS